jgi:phage shock protein A
MNFIEPVDPLVKENRSLDLFYADEKMYELLIKDDFNSYMQYVRDKQQYVREKPLLEKKNDYLEEEVDYLNAKVHILNNEIDRLNKQIEVNKYVKSNEKYKKHMIQNMFDSFDRLDYTIKRSLDKLEDKMKK